MPRHYRRIATIALATAWWVTPLGAQAPAPPPVHEHASSPDGAQHQGMMGAGMGAGHGAGIMTGVHEMFVGHEQLTRSVTLLPDGIRAVTESSDPRLAQLIKDHVTVSNAQVATGVDPGLPMESDALRSIFAYHDQIRTTVQQTPAGVVVTQTSSNPQAVAALQQHAAEVTTFVTEGMAAMHAAMMKKRGR
jgi:hypothetical protein